jgi:hypothetical protein
VTKLIYYDVTLRYQQLDQGEDLFNSSFGNQTSFLILGVNCRTPDVDNLYGVDGSFFLYSTAISPSMTIIANALRVGDRLIERMK